MEEFENGEVGRVSAEVGPEKEINATFKHEGVVDGDHADLWPAVPARLRAARVRCVHDVVGDEEEGLEEFGQPAQGGRVGVFMGRERAGEQVGGGVGDGEAAVVFPAEGIVGEGLGKPI